MGAKEYQVTATVRDWICDHCEHGRMRPLEDLLARPNALLHSSMRQVLHGCNHCGEQAYFTTIFPVVVVKDRQFVSREALLTNKGLDGDEPGVSGVS